MKLAEDFPFYADMIAPPHGTRIYAGGLSPQNGEIEIDQTWSIESTLSEGPSRTAGDDLADFLRGAMDVELARAEDDRSANVIVLAVDASLGDEETHRITVSADRVEVAGGGPRGVLHGVFRLEDLLRRRRAPFLADGFAETRKPLFESRIHRSCMSPFYAEETTGYREYPYAQPEEHTLVRGWLHEDASVDAFYHDRILLNLARHGFNGVWLRGCLRQLAKVEVFPEFGDNAEVILQRLDALGRRARGFGIDLFLYMQEPHGFMPGDPFWKAHPDCRGAADKYTRVHALCTSVPKVKTFLREGTRFVFERVSSLKGLILITASEFQTHCYSRFPTVEAGEDISQFFNEEGPCPRCIQRQPQEVVAEIVTLMADGARQARPDADVIAWNWGWQMYEKDPQAGVLERLASDIHVMGSYEIGEPTHALDIDYVNEEYSIRLAGPSVRFKGMSDYHKARGGRVYAKLQIGTTHEDPTVPCLPLMQKIAQKYRSLREGGVSGLMTCWNFANMPSRVTELAGLLSWDPQPEDLDDELLRLAQRDFGEAADAVVEAWGIFSRAWEDFPGSIPVMYFGPIGRGPAWHFHLEKVDREMTYSWLILKDINGDSLDWTEPFGPEATIKCLEAQLDEWRRGEARMAESPAPAANDQKVNLDLELGLARIIGCQLTTAVHVGRFLLARNRMYETDDGTEKGRLLDELAAILQQEKTNSLASLPLVDADSRLGFHGEAYGYMFNRELIEKKLEALEETLTVKLPALRQSLPQ